MEFTFCVRDFVERFFFILTRLGWTWQVFHFLITACVAFKTTARKGCCASERCVAYVTGCNRSAHFSSLQTIAEANLSKRGLLSSNNSELHINLNIPLVTGLTPKLCCYRSSSCSSQKNIYCLRRQIVTLSVLFNVFNNKLVVVIS